MVLAIPDQNLKSTPFPCPLLKYSICKITLAADNIALTFQAVYRSLSAETKLVTDKLLTSLTEPRICARAARNNFIVNYIGIKIKQSCLKERER